MTEAELEYQVREIAQAFDKAPPSQRLQMQPGVERIIRTLQNRNQKIPVRLRQIETELRAEEDDFFDNMPI
ncbi:MAG: hypothetical protein AAF307_06240 [Pseudomonadota bacterium]